MNRYILSGLFFCLVAVTARGEVIQLKNGDQLTGKWVQVLHGGLKFSSDVLGEVTIPVKKMKSFSAPKSAVVILKDNEAIRGNLSLLTSGDWQVASEKGIRVVPVDVVEAIYPREIYEAKSLENTLAPWKNWRGSASFGYAAARGDLQSTTWNLGMNAIHKSPDLPGLTERWRTNFLLNGLFSTTRNTTSSPITNNSITSSLRQDLLFTPNDFVFTLAQLDHIETQNLDLRQTYGAGFGRDLRRGSRTQLSLLGGSTLVVEQFQDGTRRENIEGLIGEKVGIGLNGRIRLQHFFNFYPSLTSSGQFRFETITTVSTRLFSHVSLLAGFTDRYLGQPPVASSKPNEASFTTGFGYNF